MKLLTYNIHYWEGTDGVTDVDRTIAAIRDSGADIIGLNEVYHPASVKGMDQPALEYLAAQLGMQFIYGQAHTFTLAFDRPGRSFGNALLSRWPILASAAHHLTPVAGHEQRGLLEARILLPDGQRTLTVYVTHLDHLDEEVRLTQAQALLAWTARDRSRPHVLMGDFNTFSLDDYATPEALDAFRRDLARSGWEGYEARVLPRLLKAGYADAWALAGNGPAATCCNEPEPLFRIDYVLVSQPLAGAVRSCRRWDADPAPVASDHLPVLVELED